MWKMCSLIHKKYVYDLVGQPLYIGIVRNGKLAHHLTHVFLFTSVRILNKLNTTTSNNNASCFNKTRKHICTFEQQKLTKEVNSAI